MNEQVVRSIVAMASVIALGTWSASLAEPVGDDSYMQGKLAYSPLVNRHYLVLANLSDQFLCISSGVFDGHEAALAIKGRDGKTVFLKENIDSAISLYRQVDITPPYYFLGPNRTRQFDIFLDYYHIGPGEYEFEVQLPYYLCADIVAKPEKNQEGPVLRHKLSFRGNLSVPSK